MWLCSGTSILDTEAVSPLSSLWMWQWWTSLYGVTWSKGSYFCEPVSSSARQGEPLPFWLKRHGLAPHRGILETRKLLLQLNLKDVHFFQPSSSIRGNLFKGNDYRCAQIFGWLDFEGRGEIIYNSNIFITA